MRCLLFCQLGRAHQPPRLCRLHRRRHLQGTLADRVVHQIAQAALQDQNLRRHHGEEHQFALAGFVPECDAAAEDRAAVAQQREQIRQRPAEGALELQEADQEHRFKEDVSLRQCGFYTGPHHRSRGVRRFHAPCMPRPRRFKKLIRTEVIKHNHPNFRRRSLSRPRPICLGEAKSRHGRDGTRRSSVLVFLPYVFKSAPCAPALRTWPIRFGLPYLSRRPATAPPRSRSPRRSASRRSAG